MGDPLVSVIVPTYNERENLPTLVEKIHKVLSSYCDYEIVVVDDNSPDGTWKIAEELSKRYPLCLIRRRAKLGLSSAVLMGFREARGELLCVMDADLQHPPELLLVLIERIRKGADIVIASRYILGGKIENWELRRRIISIGAKFVAKIFLPKIRNIKDPLSGYFIVRRKVIREIQLNPVGYKILLEILAKGKYERVEEVPFTFRAREKGKSKLRLKEYTNFIRHVYRLSRDTGEFNKILKYILLGLVVIIISLFIVTKYF